MENRRVAVLMVSGIATVSGRIYSDDLLKKLEKSIKDSGVPLVNFKDIPKAAWTGDLIVVPKEAYIGKVFDAHLPRTNVLQVAFSLDVNKKDVKKLDEVLNLPDTSYELFPIGEGTTNEQGLVNSYALKYVGVEIKIGKKKRAPRKHKEKPSVPPVVTPEQSKTSLEQIMSEAMKSVPQKTQPKIPDMFLS
jgi:hypothetical protein